MASEQLDSSDSEVAMEEIEDGSSSTVHPAKRARVSWQETLLSLVAAQQDQIKQLSQQSNIATGPIPGTSTANMSVIASFRLAEFNPDVSDYAIEEWLETATKLKEELQVGDALIIAKAGEALKGRAHRYYCDWRPVCRTWDEFCKDLIVAFPDRETPGARAFTAATLRSRDCDSLSDYGIQKLRAIERFYNKLPWNTIVSMVEYGLDQSEAQAAIRIQQPSASRELLKLLSEFDARHRTNRVIQRLQAADTIRFRNNNNNTHTRFDEFDKKGKCFRCGQEGHQQRQCRFSLENINDHKKTETDIGKQRERASIPSCTHCKKIGHIENNCWYKHGKPKQTNNAYQARS